MNKKITLNDLTKKELIDLIYLYGLQRLIKDSYILEVRYGSIVKKAGKLMDEAQSEMKEYAGSMNTCKQFLEATDKFDKAMKLYDEAESMLL